MKADAGSGEEMTDMMQRCARGTTATAVMAVVMRAVVVVVVVATMIFIFGVSLRASARGGCVRGLRLDGRRLYHNTIRRAPRGDQSVSKVGLTSHG